MDGVPRHITMELFQAQSTTRATFATIIEPLLKDFNLLDILGAFAEEVGLWSISEGGVFDKSVIQWVKELAQSGCVWGQTHHP